MDSSTFEIHGEDNIQQHISTMLRQTEKRLEASCESIADEMLFTVLEGANYICLDLVKLKREVNLSLTVPVLQALRWFIVALDPSYALPMALLERPMWRALRLFWRGSLSSIMRASCKIPLEFADN